MRIYTFKGGATPEKDIISIARKGGTPKNVNWKEFFKHDHYYSQLISIILGDMYLEKDAQDVIKKSIIDFAINHFRKIFKEKNEIDEIELGDIQSDLTRKLESKAEGFRKDIKNRVIKSISKILGIKTGGNLMFKTLKAAKKFTAHLDALANEIQNLGEIDENMRLHLAERLDKLSDMIEEESYHNEKVANGIGSGSWAYDQDEAKYMSSFGGTGSLEGDADEKRYMDEFVGDDHKEVLNRNEPAAIRDDGQKVKQPSDNYNEAEVANSLKNAIKKILSEKIK